MEGLVEAMSTQAHAELWAALREDLRLKLGEELFERWIAAIKVLSDSGEVLRLGVANKFVQDWIQKRYLAAMGCVVRERCGERLRLELGMDPESAPEPLAAEVDPALGDDRAGGPGEKRVVAGRLKEAGNGECHDQTLKSFIVGESNKLAFNAATEVLEKPGRLYNPLFFYGPTGVGKTHLLKGLHRAFRGRRRHSGSDAGGAASPFLRVVYLTGEQFFQQFVASIQERTLYRFQERYRTADVLILDDVHALITKKKTQLEFLHTFSALGDLGGQVILASDVPPKGLKDLDAGLVGRFLSGLVVGMKKPEFKMRLGIARSLALRIGLVVVDAVLVYIAENLRGNAREVAGAVKIVHHHTRMQEGALDPQRACDLLAEYVREHTKRLDLVNVHEAVARYYNLAAGLLLQEGRQKHVCLARQVAMYLCRRYTGRSLAEVGKYFGNRNHTTVRCAESKVSRLVQAEGSSVARDVAAIAVLLEE